MHILFLGIGLLSKVILQPAMLLIVSVLMFMVSLSVHWASIKQITNPKLYEPKTKI